MKLTNRYIDAVALALKLHSGQFRKGTSIPYFSHLLSVSALVIENGGNEDQAIAALLHDAVEDQGGVMILDEINLRFGNKVAKIVENCSDSLTSPKPKWKKRKENYLTHLKFVDEETLLVSLCDKIHNANSILLNHAEVGNAIWERFKGKKSGTKWYYLSLAIAFERYFPGNLSSYFKKIANDINDLD